MVVKGFCNKKLIIMFKFIYKVFTFAHRNDISYFFNEKYFKLIGNINIRFSKLLYGTKLEIKKKYNIWGKIRFLIYGEGKIVIGYNFHAVSERRRSFITLYSPCHLTTIGNAEIIIGDNVGLNGTTITARKLIKIGDYTMIGPNTIIVDNDGHNAWPPRERWVTSGKAEEVVIENDVWIGMNCLILKGVKIGRGSIISAGSVVINDVDANSLYAGNPAKKIKSLI
jgi:acetyltransferase-like isoleucine patch superfamily enzyme